MWVLASTSLRRSAPPSELIACCLADYFTASFPSYFRADSAGVPALTTLVK
jgi:hypothetical protein